MKNQWYLRTQDETFGPETKERLLEWARMGRIQPGQDISEDGETWRSVFRDDQLRETYKVDLRKAPCRARQVRVRRQPGVKNEVFHLGKILVYGRKLY